MFRELGVWFTYMTLASGYLSLWIEVTFRPTGLWVMILFMCFLHMYMYSRSIGPWEAY
jgi:hypothetical protein